MNRRYELKYGIEHCDLNSIIHSIRCHPAAFKMAYPNRQVNNIYLDTVQLHHFYQNLDGVADRVKFRYRWYGDLIASSTEVRLEAKFKSNELGWKKHCDLTMDLIRTEANLKSHFERLRWSWFDLVPTVYNSYERFYFISNDARFRLTLDHNQKFGKPYFGDQFVKSLTKSQKVVIELKFDENNFEASNFITQHLPFVRTKNSKYSDGVIATFQ